MERVPLRKAVGSFQKLLRCKVESTHYQQADSEIMSLISSSDIDLQSGTQNVDILLY